METKLHKIVIRMSKLTIYALIICQSLVMVLANGSEAQRKHLEEIEIEISSQEKARDLLGIISEIEAKGDFTFAYSKRDVKHKTIQLTKGKWNMNSLLKEVSIQARLSIRRVNETIALLPVGKQELPDVGEELSVQEAISGKITDENGEGLPGATILEKGTGNGTISDIEGNFSLYVTDGAILIVSFVGYQSQEVAVQGQSTINVYLAPDLESLEEVIVIGYGTQKKSDLTGSVSSIGSEAIATRPISNISDVFQGNASGVAVNTTSGAPGSGAQIRIRGIGSINSGVSPLIVLDGLPYNGNLSSINAYDIASIEILKDASSTAIYGSRGSNGVVLITTKRGKNTGVEVNYNGTYGVQKLRKKIDLLNGTQYAELINEAYTNSAGEAPYSAADIASIHNNGKGTDWQDEFYQDAPIQTHQIAARGGNENVLFYLSANYLNQEGIIKSSDFEKFSLRANFDVNLGEKLSMGNSLAISRETSSGVSAYTGSRSNDGNSNVVYSALIARPDVPAYDENGDLNLETTIGEDPGPYQNPLLLLQNQNDMKRNQTTGNVYLKYDITDWLSAKTTFGFNLVDQMQGTYIVQAIVGSNGGRAGRVATQSTNWVSTNQLDFNKTFGDHSLNGVVVAEAQQVNSETFSASSQTFVLDNLTYDALETGSNPQIPTSGASEWSLASYLARVNYTYKDKYLLTVSGRYDGASRLATGNKWNLFPSAAVSWKVSNESFMSSVEAIDELKLGVTYGESGNQSVGVYNTLSQLGGDQAIIGVNQDINTGFAPQNFPNKDLTWEISKQLDIGADISMFKARVKAEASYFNRETEGLFFDRGIPSVIGTNSLNSTANIGGVRNRGFEIDLNAAILEVGDFTWDVNANFTYTRNEVLALAESDTIITGYNGEFRQGEGSQLLYVGGRLGAFRGWLRDGLYGDDVSLTLDGDTRSPGDLKYVDVDGDGDITINDRVALGNAIPDKFWGFTSTFGYKGISLSVFLQGSHGNKIVNYNRVTYLENLTAGGNKSIVALDRWTSENTETNIPKTSLTAQPFRFSDEWLEDGSYVRFKTITLGYDFPRSILDKIGGIRSLRVYTTGTNLITFSDYSGYDPDVTSSSNVTQQGYDQGIYPASKSIVFGVNIGL